MSDIKKTIENEMNNNEEVIVTREGAQMTPQEEKEDVRRETAAGRQSQSPAASSGRRKSAFRTSKRFRAGSFKYGDTTFDYAEITERELEGYQQELDRISGKFETSVEAFNSGDVDEATTMLIFKEIEPIIDGLLQKCIIDWDDVDQEYDPRQLVYLGYECKRALITHVVRASITGFSQNDFLALQ